MTEEKIEEKPEEKIEAVSQLQQDLQACQDKYLRVLAESENVRKRMQKERQEWTKYSIENVLVEFFHPIDSFEKALQFAETMSDEVKNWAVGFEMILNQFKQIFSNHGVEEYHSVGKPFDPHFHEAVEMVETTEYEPGIVVEEYVRGYKVGDRAIRVARVKVAKAPEQKTELEKTKQED
ncbi:MAG: nucleotide exchange factor GrpE [Chlamydiales bacterium]